MKQEEKNLPQTSGQDAEKTPGKPVQAGQQQEATRISYENEMDRFEGNMDNGELGGNLNSINQNKDHEQRK